MREVITTLVKLTYIVLKSKNYFNQHSKSISAKANIFAFFLSPRHLPFFSALFT